MSYHDLINNDAAERERVLELIQQNLRGSYTRNLSTTQIQASLNFLKTGSLGLNLTAGLEALRALTQNQLTALGQQPDKLPFFYAILPAALACQLQYQVPAAAIMGQIALETGLLGSKGPVYLDYNLGNVKSFDSREPRRLSKYLVSRGTPRNEAYFKVFTNFVDAILAIGANYRKGLYDPFVKQYIKDGDIDKFIRDAGKKYAPSGVEGNPPDYGDKVINIMNTYGLKQIVEESLKSKAQTKKALEGAVDKGKVSEEERNNQKEKKGV